MTKTVTIGIGAHIKAAVPRGPRFDGSLTPAQRRSPENGIWLCGICAKLIDSDEARYTVDVLRGWKAQAGEAASKAISTLDGGRARAPLMFELDDADQQFLAGLGLLPADNIDDVTRRLRDAAMNDLASFRRAREWPDHTVALDLFLETHDGQVPVTLDTLADGLGLMGGASLVSAPGTGKTTTTIQLGEHVLGADGPVPLFVPLGEWSDRTDDFFDLRCANRRSAASSGDT